MWKLKDLNLTFKTVKEIVTSYNEAGISEKIKVVGATGEALLIDLINKINVLQDENMAKIPKNVSVVYDALPDYVFNSNVPQTEVENGTKETDEETPAPTDLPDETTTQEPENKPESVEETKHNSSCPVFGKGYNPKEPTCQTCGKDFHQDYIECKRIVKGIVQAGKKKGTRKVLTSEVSSKKSRYGHRLNTMAACIDDLVWAGTDYDVIIKTIMNWHARTDAAAKHAFTIHTKYLSVKYGIAIFVDDKNIVKSDKEYIEGRNADNTAPAVPSVIQE